MIPTGKNLVIINTPFSYEEVPLCPLDIMSVNTLKLISYLKSLNNNVAFINMRARESYFWKEASAGLDGSATVMMRIMGKSRQHLLEMLKGLNTVPDEIWISCVFTFDYEIVLDLIDTCRIVFPETKIIAGGDFARGAPELASRLSVEVYTERVEGADLAEPDFSVMDGLKYGIFQLSMGCPHHCSFCVAGMDTPRVMNIDRVIAYMQDYSRRNKPDVFWNWDPNVLVFKEEFEAFLDKFAQSGITAKLRFGKGFQANLMTEKLVKKMASVGTIGASLPIETADSITLRKYNKPYSIISSVKMLTLAAKYKFDLGSSQCTFVIGYPEDNFSSIFRAYLTVLMLGGKPTPFPVFLFPNSEDYHRYSDLLRGKDLAELHGQRWPLIESRDVPKYQNLLRFLLIPDMATASRNISLLSPELLDIYLKEKFLIEDFISLCQSAKSDTHDELVNIEKQLEMKLLGYEESSKCLKVVYIIANPKRSGKSITRELGNYFVDKLRDKYTNCDVHTINLYDEGIPFITEEYIDAVFRDLTDLSEETQLLVKKADDYIRLLRNADRIIVSCPMWTFSIPSILKAFFEIVTSRMFYYHHQTIEDKPVLCILARHGNYIPPQGSSPNWRPKYINSQESSLVSAFQIMGVVRGLRFICAEGLFQPDNRQAVMENAKRDLDTAIETF